MSSCLRTLAGPCDSCPWRLDRGAHDIPGFDMSLAEGLASSSPDDQGMGPDFGAGLFACHQTHEGKELACAGWLATVGSCHPMVRLAVLRNDLPLVALRPGPGWPLLHESYGDVLRKLRSSYQGQVGPNSDNPSVPITPVQFRTSMESMP